MQTVHVRYPAVRVLHGAPEYWCVLHDCLPRTEIATTFQWMVFCISGTARVLQFFLFNRFQAAPCHVVKCVNLLWFKTLCREGILWATLRNIYCAMMDGCMCMLRFAMSGEVYKLLDGGIIVAQCGVVLDRLFNEKWRSSVNEETISNIVGTATWATTMCLDRCIFFGDKLLLIVENCSDGCALIMSCREVVISRGF